MVCVYATNKVLKEKEKEFVAIAKELVEETLKERGCISYEFCKKDSLYVFFERWENENYLNLHTKTPHFLKFVPIMEGLRVDGELTILEKLF